MGGPEDTDSPTEEDEAMHPERTPPPQRLTLPLLALGTAVVVLTGCQDARSPAAPDVEPQLANCARNPNHPHCGGGGGGDDSFDGGNVISTYLAGHDISGGPYLTVKKKSAIQSTLDAGAHRLYIDPSAGETVCISVAVPDEIRNAALWAQFLSLSGATPGGEPWCTAAIRHHTRDNTNLLTMTDGEGRVTGGKLVLKEFDTPGGPDWQWRLIYDDSRIYRHETTGELIDHSEWMARGMPSRYQEGANDTGVCVSYEDASQTWTLGTDASIHPDCAGTVDGRVNLIHLPDSGGFVWIATLRLRFVMTATP